MAADTGYRRIPPGACTWCGHAPHDVACTSRIRTGAVNDKATYAACPCSRHEQTRDQRVEAAEDRAEQVAFDAARERS